MARVCPSSSGLRVATKLFALIFGLCSLAYGQILNQDQTIYVHGLPVLMARSQDASDVLLASLDTILHDREICCGKDSALGDAAQAADPTSLKDVATKLNGRHLLSDGRPITVTAEYLAPDQISSGQLISKIRDQHAGILQWNSHLYVLHGIVYLWTAETTPDGTSGPAVSTIHRLFLLDTRYSDARRDVEFNRETDDVGKVQGWLFVQAKPE